MADSMRRLHASEWFSGAWPVSAAIQPLQPCVKPYFRSSTFRLMYTRLGATSASRSLGRRGGSSSSDTTGSLATMVGTSPDSFWTSPGVKRQG